MKSRSLAALVVLGLLALAPNAAAFHGAYYKATGVATKDDVAYVATVEWLGYFPCHCFRVSINDPLTGAVLDHREFAGDETFQGPFFVLGEAFLYHGFSVDPAVSFDLQGTFVNAFNEPPYPGQMVYQGHYQGYTVVVVVVEVLYNFVDAEGMLDRVRGLAP